MLQSTNNHICNIHTLLPDKLLIIKQKVLAGGGDPSQVIQTPIEF